LKGWELGSGHEEELVLTYLDGIAVPPGVMRSFKNASDNEALLLSILGGNEPGHVVWANSMRQLLGEAKK
jgi:hypothetical protein